LPLDPHARRLLKMLSVTGASGASLAGIGERRRAFRGLMQFSGEPVEIGAVEDRGLPGPDGAIGIRLYTPLEAPAGPLPGLVFFHGGGLVAGSLDTHDPLCRALANATGCRIVAVDYRLAPEHKFPAAVVEASAAWTWVIEHAATLDLDPVRIGVAGDSAGGALAIVTCAQARAARAPTPALQLLLCPITDFGAETGSRETFASGYLIDKTTIQQDLDHYLPSGMLPIEPEISPLRLAGFGGLPPAFVHTAEFDPFRDEGEAYVRRLLDAGVAAVHTCHPGMPHLFYAMPSAIPSGREAIRQIGAEVRAAFRQWN
jgi:acetyl esterase/lipase